MARNTQNHQAAIANQNSMNQNQGVQNQLNGDLSQNPYYLHPNESPSQVMVTSIISGSNYHTWARSMKSALISKNKFRFVNDSIIKLNEFDHLY